jgi:hypothetical protein
MDKFVLAENPMRDDADVYIVHLLTPVAIFKAQQGHIDIPGKIFRHYQFENNDGFMEQWTLSVHHFFTTDFLTEPDQQADKLIGKAWRWYRSYLDWEDSPLNQ